MGMDLELGSGTVEGRALIHPAAEFSMAAATVRALASRSAFELERPTFYGAEYGDRAKTVREFLQITCTVLADARLGTPENLTPKNRPRSS